MMRKLLIVALCGFVQRFECSRVKFDQAFQEPIYRNDLQNEPMFKREHFYPRDVIAPADQILPQSSLIRNDPMYGNEPIMGPPLPQQAVLSEDDYISSDRLMQGEQFIRAEPILRREALLRREPILRREAFIRGEPMLRAGRIFQSAPIFREGGIFRNDPNYYAVMLSQCACQEPQNVEETGPQEGFFQISQPIQPMQQPAMPMPQPVISMQQPAIAIQPSPISIPQPGSPMGQPLMAHRLFFQKPMLKPHQPTQMFQPIIALPRFQRLLRKGCKPIAENIPFPAAAVQSPPVQDLNSLNNEPVTFPGSFQNQGQQQESTSESAQSSPVTVRNVPSPLALAQMSSIC